MKCPKCNNGSVKFDVKLNSTRRDPKGREDFNATCKCSWKGIIYDELMDKYEVKEKKKEAW